MKRLALAVLAAATLSVAAPAAASGDAADQAAATVSDLGQKTVKEIAGDGLSKAEVEAMLDANFDIDLIGRFALGRYWRLLGASEKRAYLDLFQEMVATTYAGHFAEVSGEPDFEVGRASQTGSGDVLVASRVDSGKRIKLVWRLRQSESDWRVIDVQVEGVSMALSQRNEFTSLISRNGGNPNALLSRLRRKYGSGE